jgi:hypothetical protein
MLSMNLSFVDSVLIAFLSPATSVVVGGAVAGVASMLIYWQMSPQARIADVTARAARARHEIHQFDGGDVRVVGSLAKRAFGLSFQHLGLVIVPTAVALIPVFALAYWVDHAFDLSNCSLFSGGPECLRTWHTAFWLPLGISSLAVKLCFRIR